jgi:shikimate kinase
MISLFLIGFRASGKTSLGKNVSTILNIPFYDLDQIFEEQFGSISKYVAQHGWENFRAKEHNILKECKKTSALFSTGGGVVELKKNRTFLKQTHSIFIDTPLKIITNRLSSAENTRPALTQNISPKNEIIQEYKTRLPWYQEVSELQFIPTGNLENDAKNLAKQIRTRA